MNDLQTDQARQDKLEALYTADGRHSKDHPLRGVYTGLWQAWVNSEQAQESTDAG